MLIITHLSLMIVAFLCLMAGIGMAMFGRKNKNWLKLHKTINTAGWIVALAGAAMAFTNIVLSGGQHLAGWHQRIGFAAIILCGLTLYLGIYSFKTKNKVTVRTIHRWSGRVSFIMILAVITLGLQMIGIF